MTAQSNPLQNILPRVRQALRPVYDEIHGASAIQTRLNDIDSMLDLEHYPVTLPELENVTHLWERKREENEPGTREFVYIRSDSLSVETLSLDVEGEEDADKNRLPVITDVGHHAEGIGVFLVQQEEERLLERIARKLGREFRHRDDPEPDVIRQVDELARRVQPEAGFTGPQNIRHLWFKTDVAGTYENVWYIEPSQAPLGLKTDIRHIVHGMVTEGGQQVYRSAHEVMTLEHFLGVQPQPSRPQPQAAEAPSLLRHPWRWLRHYTRG